MRHICTDENCALLGKRAPTYCGCYSEAADGLISSLSKALEYVLDQYDRNVCEHEVTHRGGAIWTICEGCGQKWADDEGGFQPHCDPPGIVEARAALSLAKETK